MIPNNITRFSFLWIASASVFLSFAFGRISLAEAQQSKITNMDAQSNESGSVTVTANMAKPSSAQSQGLDTQYSTTVTPKNSKQRTTTMSVCGDGFCDKGTEDVSTNTKYCLSDCGGLPVSICNNNGTCDPGEDCINCCPDCACLTDCGNGVCETAKGECYTDCEQDCLNEVSCLEVMKHCGDGQGQLM